MTIKQTIPSAAFIILLGVAPSKANTPVDSVGIDRKGDKVYVLHKVEQKQTLFSILKRYGSNLTEYRTENPNIDEAVKIDQVIRVPFHGKIVEKKVAVAPTQTPASTPDKPVVSENGVHRVVGKEGLYGLSLRYKVTMAEVRKWNGLTQDALHEGQVLIMSEAAYERSKSSASQPTHTPAPVTPTPAPAKPEPEKELPKPLPKPVEPEKTPEKEKEEPKVVTPNPVAKNVVEKGIAEVIDVEDNSSKYLALHRSAAIGTMITVKNEANDKIVYVKVIGKLPEAAIADHIIIRLSPKAFEKLSPNDPKKVRAEINYVAQ